MSQLKNSVSSARCCLDSRHRLPCLDVAYPVELSWKEQQQVSPIQLLCVPPQDVPPRTFQMCTFEDMHLGLFLALVVPDQHSLRGGSVIISEFLLEIDTLPAIATSGLRTHLLLQEPPSEQKEILDFPDIETEKCAFKRSMFPHPRIHPSLKE